MINEILNDFRDLYLRELPQVYLYATIFQYIAQGLLSSGWFNGKE
jgi:hypothetical protein